MPCEMLVVAVPKVGLTEKGMPFLVKAMPAVWGAKEGLPNWVKVRVTDATVEQVTAYLQTWPTVFASEILQDTPQGYRVRLTVDPSVVAASGANRAMRADLKEYVVGRYGAQIVSHDTHEAVLDIPKPVNLQRANRDIHDRFATRFRLRRYRFSDADVDAAVAQGGLVEVTRAQAQSRIIDSLGV